MMRAGEAGWRSGLLVLGAVVLVIAAVAAAWRFWPQAPSADPFAQLRERGKLSVGVRRNAPPYSYQDESGAILGFEPDLARAMAIDLNLELNLVPVDEASLVGLIENHVIDIGLLPGILPETVSGSVHLIEPGYYASGLTAVTLKSAALTTWEGLAGKTACGVGNDPGAAPVIGEFGARYIGFADVATALQALSAERCDVVVEDETAVDGALAGLNDDDFVRPLATIDILPWRAAVGAEDEILIEYVRETLVEWHKSGFLIKKSEEWDLPLSPYLADMKDYFGN